MKPATKHVVMQAAERLARAEHDRNPCAPIRYLLDTNDIESAYAIQQHNVAAARCAGRRVVGRKIGLTSLVVQKQLGVGQPDFGVLFADMNVSEFELIPTDRLLQPRIEAEVAFVLGESVTHPLSPETAQHCVAEVIAAIEIVDSRITNWDITITDTIADNASSGLFVLGDGVDISRAPDPATIAMTVVDSSGAVLSKGTGSECLGSPYHALAWLANTALRLEDPLLAGDIILSGALGPLVPAIRTDTYTATLSGIGNVTAAFSAR